eukprot:4832522-Ditylum_brightwellii.AAC.1
MGNHHSSSSGGGGSASRTTTASSSLATAGGSGSRGGHHHRHSIIRRATGSLGLSKAELERRCKPSGYVFREKERGCFVDVYYNDASL